MSVSSVSNLSSASSRTEHMAYLMTDLGLDRPTATLMYRAERLQEKGQLQQALRYFDRVWSSNPDCGEAAVNARMIREQLSEQVPQLPPVSEHSVTVPAAPPPLQTADLQLTFKRSDSEKFDVYWTDAMLNDAAMEEARRTLEDSGINSPFLTLVENQIEKYTLPVDIDPWLDTNYTCRAIVRVTFPPNMTHASPALAGAVAATQRSQRGSVGFSSASSGVAPGTLASLFANAREQPHNPEPDAERSASGRGEKGAGSTRTNQPGSSSMSMLEQLRAHAAGDIIEESPVPIQTCAAAAAAATADDEYASTKSSNSRHSNLSVRSS